MKPCSQSCNMYSILMGYIWKSTELAWLVPCEYPQQGHKEAQTYNSIQWQLCTTGPKDLAQVLPGRAHGCYLSTLASLTPCHVETVHQHWKRNVVIPSPTQYSISCLCQHMPKKTILQGWKLFLVPQARLPFCGQLQRSRSLASQITGSCRQEESPSSFVSKGRL